MGEHGFETPPANDGRSFWAIFLVFSDFIFVSLNIGVEKGFEVKNDKILYYEVGAAHNIESLHKYQQERINAFVRGIHKIVISTLATMDAGI